MNNKQAQSRRQQRFAQQRPKEHVQRPKRAIKADLVFADPIKHLPEKLPDPWLFNSESLLRELDRCREMVLLIPTPTQATYFAANVAIDALWNLRQNLQYLLQLHGEGQRAFANRAEDLDAKLKATIPKQTPIVIEI